MEWIDEKRRRAFENSQSARAASGMNARQMPGELERILPEHVKRRAISIGNELIVPYDDALAAIATATEHQIAVLGFDCGEVLEDGFRVLDYSGYDRDIPFRGTWKGYVAAMNSEAERWIKGHPFGSNHGYVLTSTSEKEFAQLKR